MKAIYSLLKLQFILKSSNSDFYNKQKSYSLNIRPKGTVADESFAYNSLKSTQEFYEDREIINNINIRIVDFDDDIRIATQIQNRVYQASGWTQKTPGSWKPYTLKALRTI